MNVETWPVERVLPYEQNPRNNDGAVEAVARSIEEFGFQVPIVVNGDGVILAGHTRHKAALHLGLAEVPVVVAGDLTQDQERAFRLADNKLAEIAAWDSGLLDAELDLLRDAGFDLTIAGFSDDVLAGGMSDDGAAATLEERFLVPPFSVLDGRKGYWLDRKREWLGLGIQSEIGRDSNMTFSVSAQTVGVYKAKEQAEADAGKPLSWAEYYERHPEAYQQGGTSIFDPVLCEIVYRWFCPPGGVVFDPFAGGSVRGVVASRLGLQYVGIELRPEQVEANRAQAEDLCPGENPPVWLCGDSLDMAALLSEAGYADDAPFADLVFSCPPYGDLEVYSDDARDLSAMDYAAFCHVYRQIIELSVARLKPDRFAGFVTGDFRDKAGFYRGFPRFTADAFEAAGARLYNDAVYVTPVGSLATRTAKQFVNSRKLGKAQQSLSLFYHGALFEFARSWELRPHHQSVQVFVRGSGKSATDAIGPVEFALEDPANLDADAGIGA